MTIGKAGRYLQPAVEVHRVDPAEWENHLVKHRLMARGDVEFSDGEWTQALAAIEAPDRPLIQVARHEREDGSSAHQFRAYTSYVHDPERLFGYLDEHDNDERLCAFLDARIEGSTKRKTWIKAPADVFTEQRWGYVYLIGSDRDRFKVGFAADPAKRLAQLQTAHPEPLRILAAVPGTMDDEAYWHRFFASAQTQGEWFDTTGDAVLRDFVSDFLTAGSLMPSWGRLAPVPGSRKPDATLTGMQERMGKNYDLAKALHERHGTGHFSDFLTGLVFNEHDVVPDSPGMEYGLRAAIKAGVAKPNYVMGCVNRGIDDGKVREW